MGVRNGRGAISVVVAWDILAIPLAWYLASLVNFDIYIKIGGGGAILKQLPIVTAIQFIVYWWVGFHTGRKGESAVDPWNFFRAMLFGVLAVTLAMFFYDRLVTVSRTTLIAYPFILSMFLVAPRFLHRLKLEITGAVETKTEPPEIIVAETPPPAPYVPPAGTMGDAPPVSIIIVNFNAGRLLSEAVRSALESTVPVRVIVSDNGSDDGSVNYLCKRFGADPRLVIVENGANLGFAKGNNIVMSHTADSEFTLFLNPDCIIEPDTIKRMIDHMRGYPEVGMAGCLIRNLDGTEQAGCRRATPTPWRTFVRVTGLSTLFPNHPKFQCFVMSSLPLPEKPVYVEAISGSFMFTRREAMEVVGLMDEGYFLHCEDLDWCMRFDRAGWKILFTPDVEITHTKGASSHDRPIRVLWHKHYGMIRFYRKFFSGVYPSTLMWTVFAAVWLRFAALSLIAFVSRRREIDEDGMEG